MINETIENKNDIIERIISILWESSDNEIVEVYNSVSEGSIRRGKESGQFEVEETT
jgi:hypothetical protein